MSPIDSRWFCSSRCEEHAWKSWLEVESKCKREPLEEYCASDMVKFPMLAFKLACQTVQQQYPSGLVANVSDRPAPGIHLTDPSLGALCYINMIERESAPPRDDDDAAPQGVVVVPKEWTESYHIAMEECQLQNVPGAVGVVTLEYWYSILSRVHVNAFRLDIIDPYMHHPESLGDYSTSLKWAAAAAISNDCTGGSSVYLVASMANHSCLPNMGVRFPDNNHIIEFVALDDIQKHTHLTISYIDQGLDVAKRQEALLLGYGFTCQCEQCVDDLRQNNC
eukprot:jgi/Picsp_1/6209/NSC_03563-R1_set domain protein 123